MKLTRAEKDAVTVVLSRRNLLALLHKLDMPDSSRTIYKNTRVGNRTVLTVVRSEEDAQHYGEDVPGPMHPETEEFIAAGAETELIPAVKETQEIPQI